MPRLTLIIIALGAVVVIATTLTARFLFPPVSHPALHPAPDDRAVTAEFQRLPALEDVRQAVQLRLGSEWRVVTITGRELEQRLLAFSPTQTPGRQRAAATLLGGLDDQATLISASHGSGATLQVIALKRNGLSLDRYLDEVGQQLATAGAIVHSRIVDATLRADHLPAARLHYSLAAETSYGQIASVAGVQVATYDASAARLVVFTLTGPPSQADELPLLMGDIVAAAAF
ncbi:MAG: hypothetical protein DCC55_03945 [Chloroflexi bacterium]|nr:MAG: hypothetical protein DCC55_03945 [Chloroflexota bacterium]